jgi:hypothetical protein
MFLVPAKPAFVSIARGARDPPCSSQHGDTAPRLLLEDFLYVADFLLNFAGDFFAGAAIL